MDSMIERTCTRCKEDWPPDEEFYRPGRTQCRACDYEVKLQAPSRSPEARLREAERSKRRRAAAKQVRQ
jgi:uncharacterized Zn finger protein (UPF0148 family)